MIQPIRGTRDILPDEIIFWQHMYDTAYKLLTTSNYSEIKTPLLEMTNLFEKGLGNDTDIINKEMYSFQDQSNRNITLRPEGTASVARAFISNKLYAKSKMNRLWYFGPMFRYERPQKGRQRQFHQLGIECIGSFSPMADIEVIRLANKFLKSFDYFPTNLEINAIGDINERNKYSKDLKKYLLKYTNDLDKDSKQRLNINPFRILDSKYTKTQEILMQAPQLKSYLQKESTEHFNILCENLTYLKIPYTINNKLVRGLDYYNYTAFEIKTCEPNNQNTICGGGRYDKLIEQLGGPNTPSVGWAIGLERLLSVIHKNTNIKKSLTSIYIAIQGQMNHPKIWEIINILENREISFELDLTYNNLSTQIKRANSIQAKICFIIGKDEISNNYITIKILKTGKQQIVDIHNLKYYLDTLKTNQA